MHCPFGQEIMKLALTNAKLGRISKNDSKKENDSTNISLLIL